MIDKPLLQRRFGTAIRSYDATATVQAETARQLAALLPDTPCEGRVLEIGCGTGLLSTLLVKRLPDAEFIFNDIAPEVEPVLRKKIGPRHRFCAADAEQIPWGTGYGLIASSACIQWWQDPLAFFKKSHEALAPGGVLLYSTFLPGTLAELTRATGSGLVYPSAEQIREVLKQLGFAHAGHSIHLSTLHFSTLPDLLRHIKHTGTNALPTQTMWTPRMFEQLEQRFRSENHLAPRDSCPLTYITITGIATK